MKSLRLYSDAKVTTFDFYEDETGYHEKLSEVYTDSEYYKIIRDEIKSYTRDYGEEYTEQGLMAYFDYEGKIYDDIREKVKSAFPSVTVLTDGGDYQKIFGVCDLKISAELSKEEMEILYDYLESQYANGFGSGFEQQNIKVNIYSDEQHIQVHFWDTTTFCINTSEGIKNNGYTDLYPPKKEITQDYSNNNDFNMTM